MAYNSPSCVATLGKTGLSNCKDELGSDAMLVWTTNTFEFSTESSAETEADWITAINAGYAFPHPIFDMVEPAIEDNVIEETPNGARLFVREGKYGGKGFAITALCNLANLRTFNEVTGRAFIVTANGKIWGTSPDGVKFKGFSLAEFHVGMLGGTDGTTKRKVSWDYQFKIPSEMGDYAAVPQLTWNPLTQLTGVVPVTVAVDSSAEGSVVVSVARDCDNEAVTDLVVGDFTMLASDGSTEMLPGDGFTDNADGTYTFTFTTPVLPADTYTVNLKTPSAQTTGQLYSATADSFVIS